MTESKKNNGNHKESPYRLGLSLDFGKESTIAESGWLSHKSTKSMRLSDLMAAMYPGVKVGHKNCIQKHGFVPSTMGWLWNAEDTVTGVPLPRGWRPGAIGLGVKRLRIVVEPLDSQSSSKRKKIKRRIKTTTSSTVMSVSDIRSIQEKTQVSPSLCVQKEGGIYHIMMQPIKGSSANEDEDQQQPVKFKIADHLSTSGHTSSSSSSLKVEYLCPGALRKPVKKPEVAEIGTQWETSDFSKSDKKLKKQPMDQVINIQEKNS